MRTRVRALRSDALDGLARWVPADLEQMLELVDALVENTACSRSAAAGLVEWLVRRAVAHDDRTPDSTRFRYRALLRQLEQSGYHPSAGIPGYLVRPRLAAA